MLLKIKKIYQNQKDLLKYINIKKLLKIDKNKNI